MVKKWLIPKPKIIYLAEFILFLSIFVYGLFMFMSGYHNADLCSNEQIVEDDINILLLKNNISFEIEFSEYSLDGNKNNLRECYLNGIWYIIEGFFIAVFGAFFGGMVLGRI